ncbi:MAG TPA: FmdB family zinc ribbon protein [Bacteroidota bacterium]|nr:FmdB family zinc ribbon protein [Bacteroidota bacterium]
MPTYDYQCKNCGHTFEEFQSISADRLVVCPKCGQPSLKRILAGGSGMIFKGSGFYLTDYKKGGGESKPAEKKSTESKSEPKEPKKETKKGSDPA